MGLSRSQISQQLVYLLNASGAFGASAVIEYGLSVEELLSSGLPFPMAAVQTQDQDGDKDQPGRVGQAAFKVSACGGPITEPKHGSSYVASGGSASSQHLLEAALKKAINQSLPGTFVPSVHGFQGYVDKVSLERVVVTPGKAYVSCDVDITVTDATYQDYYYPPTRFTATPGAAHSVALSWINPPDVYSKYQNVLRRGANPGDAAPAGVSDGVGVAVTGGVLGVAATDSTPAGSGLSYAYSLFRTYTESSPGDKASIGQIAKVVTT